MALSYQEHEVAGIKTRLRDCGLRCTHARIAVLKVLQDAATPITHADLTEQLAPTGIDKATVFRNLNHLAEANLIRRNELGDHVWRFEVIEPGNENDHHPHFVCVDCGNVTCLNDPDLTVSFGKTSSDFGRITDVVIRGYCATCEETNGLE